MQLYHRKCRGMVRRPWRWLLRDVVRLPDPIPARGALGLWALSPGLSDVIWKAVRPTAGRQAS